MGLGLGSLNAVGHSHLRNMEVSLEFPEEAGGREVVSTTAVLSPETSGLTAAGVN